MTPEQARRARNALVFGVALSMCFWIPVIGTVWQWLYG